MFGKEKEVNSIINVGNFLSTASFWAKTLPRLCSVAEGGGKRVSKVAGSYASENLFYSFYLHYVTQSNFFTFVVVERSLRK